MENNQFNEEEFLKKVEEAAAKGAKSNSLKPSILSILNKFQSVLTLLIAVVVLMGFLSVSSKWKLFGEKVESFFTLNSFTEHDLGLENHGWFGYTAADFSEVILSEGKTQSELVVYTKNFSEEATAINAGFLGWGALTKEQTLEYVGKAVYAVNLSTLKASDIMVDQNSGLVIISVDRVYLRGVEIDKINFNDPKKGLLAFGDVKLTMEQQETIRNEAIERVIVKLEKEHVINEASISAKDAIYNIYQPLVSSINKGLKVQIVFK